MERISVRHLGTPTGAGQGRLTLGVRSLPLDLSAVGAGGASTGQHRAELNPLGDPRRPRPVNVLTWEGDVETPQTPASAIGGLGHRYNPQRRLVSPKHAPTIVQGVTFGVTFELHAPRMPCDVGATHRPRSAVGTAS